MTAPEPPALPGAMVGAYVTFIKTLGEHHGVTVSPARYLRLCLDAKEARVPEGLLAGLADEDVETRGGNVVHTDVEENRQVELVGAGVGYGDDEPRDQQCGNGPGIRAFDPQVCRVGQ